MVSVSIELIDAGLMKYVRVNTITGINIGQIFYLSYTAGVLYLPLHEVSKQVIVLIQFCIVDGMPPEIHE